MFVIWFGLFWFWIIGIYLVYWVGGGVDGVFNVVFEAGVVYCWFFVCWVIC